METLVLHHNREDVPFKLQMKDACDALKGHSDIEIFAFLTLARSIEPDFQYANEEGSLPIEQVKAVSILRGWPDDLIFQSLEWARCNGAIVDQPQDDRRQLINSPSGFDGFANANEINGPFGLNPWRFTRIIDQNQERHSTFDQSRLKTRKRKRKLSNSKHRYWCTVCGPDDQHSYLGSNQWKKHEKEHEITFPCLPNGLLDMLEKDGVCTFCGMSSPDEEHFTSHNVEECLRCPPTFKRGYQMASHLENQHGCVNSNSLTRKWRLAPQKQAWSCGFCVTLFTSLRDRLKHIGKVHFEQDQSLSEWSLTKVIEGLLLQPNINEAWLGLLNSLYPFSRQSLTWNNDMMPDLQQRLEMGVTVESAEQLAQATYDAADLDLTCYTTTINEPSDTSTQIMLPPPITERGKSYKRPWKSTSRMPTSNPINNSLPVAQTATSFFFCNNGTSPLSSHSSDPFDEEQSATKFYHDQHSETSYGEQGGLATPLSDEGFKSHPHQSQQFVNSLEPIALNRSVIGFTMDQERYDVGMQI